MYLAVDLVKGESRSVTYGENSAWCCVLYFGDTNLRQRAKGAGIQMLGSIEHGGAMLVKERVYGLLETSRQEAE